MESKLKLAGHPLHPMLVVFPLGLLIASVVFDVIFLVSRRPGFAFVSYAIIAAGVGMGILAAIPGVVDWLKIPRGTRARAVGLWHGITALLVIALFAASWVARFLVGGTPSAGAVAYSFGGALLAVISGWLGQELVTRLGIGVDPGAQADAPSSLTRDAGGEERSLPSTVVPFPRERHT